MHKSLQFAIMIFLMSVLAACSSLDSAPPLPESESPQVFIPNVTSQQVAEHIRAAKRRIGLRMDSATDDKLVFAMPLQSSGWQAAFAGAGNIAKREAILHYWLQPQNSGVRVVSRVESRNTFKNGNVATFDSTSKYVIDMTKELDELRDLLKR